MQFLIVKNQLSGVLSSQYPTLRLSPWDVKYAACLLHDFTYLDVAILRSGCVQRALLRTAQEVAKGMDYIHGFGIVHGDLKPGNVLLKTHRIDRRGYIAKVSDFGALPPLMAVQAKLLGHCPQEITHFSLLSVIRER